jgi:hypothetical protein
MGRCAVWGVSGSLALHEEREPKEEEEAFGGTSAQEIEPQPTAAMLKWLSACASVKVVEEFFKKYMG